MTTESATVPDASLAKDKKIAGLIYTSKNYDSLQLAKPFNPFGNKRLANFELDQTDLVTAGKQVIESVKANLK